MLISTDVVTAFGVSALLSFVVFTALLLLYAVLSGMFRARKCGFKAALTKHIVHEKLLQNVPVAIPSAPEPTPPSEKRLLGAQE